MLKNKLKLLVVIPTFYPEIKYGGPIIALYNQLYHLSKEIYLKKGFYQKNKTKFAMHLCLEMMHSNLISNRG